MEQLAKVILYDTPAARVTFDSIATVCNTNRNKKQIYKFSESSKSGMQRFEETHATHESRFGHSCHVNMNRLQKK